MSSSSVLQSRRVPTSTVFKGSHHVLFFLLKIMYVNLNRDSIGGAGSIVRPAVDRKLSDWINNLLSVRRR